MVNLMLLGLGVLHVDYFMRYLDNLRSMARR